MELTRPPSRQPLPNDAREVFKGVLFDVYQWEIQGYDGSVKTFEKIKRPDSAMVIPVTEDGKIILGLQEQPNKEPFVGLIGGRVNEGENALVAAKRELLEETGYKTEDWSLFDAIQPVGKIEWAVYTFIAKRCKKVAEQDLDGAEKIKLTFVDFDEFINIASQKEFADQELKIRILEAKADPSKMAEIRKSILG
jgi:8-oxo-dGTP pyrophosphatase MutT (NUDIX family)